MATVGGVYSGSGFVNMGRLSGARSWLNNKGEPRAQIENEWEVVEMSLALSRARCRGDSSVPAPVMRDDISPGANGEGRKHEWLVFCLTSV